MKKVGIVSIYDNDNYGNRLQNYAVHKTLQKKGYRTENILIENKFSLKRILKRKLKKICYIFLKSYLISNRSYMVRLINFNKFNEIYTPSKIYYTSNWILKKNISKKYDKFVVGSDQVWNYKISYGENNLENFLLTTVDSNYKYTFSPSFGVKSIPLELQQKYSEALKNFVNLTSREETGVELLKSLTGREDVSITIDPTLMLESCEWLEIAKEITNLPKKFVLDYFLTDTPTDDNTYKSVSKGIERVKLLDINNKKIYISGPSEFIYLFSKAEMICTDSFHACIFAILFDKPFVVYKRSDEHSDMFSRIETLLGMFGIEANKSIGKILKIESTQRDEILRIKRNELFKSLQL